MKKQLFFILITITLVSQICALTIFSEESSITKTRLDEANASIKDMTQRNIPTERVTELYKEAYQTYTAQVALERIRGTANYKVAIEKLDEIEKIKEIAYKAKDELDIFKEFYKTTATSTNLSSMEQEYREIIASFEEERFEETSGLIKKGYEKLSEIEASQTTLNLFYETTSKTIKNFLKNNWLKILITFIGILTFGYFFHATFSKIRIKRKIKNLEIIKNTLRKLIKEAQSSYFKKKKISKLEYDIKIKKFTEMIRDVDRQIPLLKEEKARINKKKKRKRKPKRS